VRIVGIADNECAQGGCFGGDMDVAKSKPKGGMDAATKASTRKTCPNGTFSTVSNRLKQSVKGGVFLFARI